MSRWDSGRISGHTAFGVFLLLLGVLTLLNNLDIIDIPPLWRLLWPAVIIWVGLNILWRGSPKGEGAGKDSSSFLNISAVLGGADHRNSAKNFSGGSLTAFLGGVKVDLREAKMEQDEATIEIFTILGGTEIFVPSDWRVDSRITPMLGGYDDKTYPAKEPAKRLILRGTVILGGVEVKS